MVDSTGSKDSKSDLNSELSLEQIAARKDEVVRFLEKRSLSLLSFTYTHNPDRAIEINRTLEHDMNLILLNAHKKLAYYRLYGDASSVIHLKQCEKLVEEAEDCYARFQNVKRLNPNPTTTAIVHVFGIEDLCTRSRQSQSDIESVNNAYETILESCKRLLDNCLHIRKMLSNLRERSRVIFYKQAQVASLIDEVAIFKGLCVSDKVAENLHSACLGQIASEFMSDVWASKIKDCRDNLEVLKSDAQLFYKSRGTSAENDGIMSLEQKNIIKNEISKNTTSILQLSRGANSIKQQLSKHRQL
ncbi:hypothetical protein BdWA1_002018 [Babesia duncani]|uniref:Uncharacterized protein n=1 Tax=Babesia duncani TaxID=323732 RepID=A0AAD9PKZ1_9APIC|nr:hypothetical protein BdWA1_002018 [Babesia duncani]